MYHAVMEDLGGGDAAAGIKRLVVLFSKENTGISTPTTTTTTTTATAAALCGPGRKLLQSAGNVISFCFGQTDNVIS